MTKEEAALRLVERFPEKREAWEAHCRGYGELLGHVFFADEINLPLVALLAENREETAIENYCAFVEEMWFQGDRDTRNIVEVTIVERLSDDPVVWLRFGEHISKEFRWDINDQILPLLGLAVPKLPTDGKRRRRRAKEAW